MAQQKQPKKRAPAKTGARKVKEDNQAQLVAEAHERVERMQQQIEQTDSLLTETIGPEAEEFDWAK